MTGNAPVVAVRRGRGSLDARRFRDGLGQAPPIRHSHPSSGRTADTGTNRLSRRISWLTWTALVVAALVAVPVLSVLSSIFQPGQGNWPHLVETVLPLYIANSLLLMAGVSAGVIVAGVGPAWLVVMYRFPGRRLFEWALILPLAVPAYVVAYAYTDFLQAAGPLQTWIRDLTGWGSAITGFRKYAAWRARSSFFPRC